MDDSRSTSSNGRETPAVDLLPTPGIPDHELLQRIGQGAYGEVWIARSVTGALRAVKIVRRASFGHARPFEREFEGIQRFEPLSRRHESQLDILHVGRGEDYFYYVMELADDQVTGGQIDAENYHPKTLKSDLLFRNRLSFEDCLSVGIALATALQHLHENGLVHRDVKPSNIVFVNGLAKLADIGLVTGLDTTRSYVGTEGFAAPEGPGTPQADLYSLGKVLYEISTGKDRQDFPELPTNLRELPDREGIAELNAVIARACRHDPADRYQTAAAMRSDLELLQSGKSLARLRRAEERYRRAQRFGAVLAVICALIASVFLFQREQTSKARALAKQNFDLAAQNAALAADKTKLAEENRVRLVQSDISNGIRLLDDGDPGGALVWFAAALPLLTNTPAQEEVHRIRIQETLERLPKLKAVLPHESRPMGLSCSSSGDRIAIGTADGWLHLWTAEGKTAWPPVQIDSKPMLQVGFSTGQDKILATSIGGTSPRGQSVPGKFGCAVDAVRGTVLWRRDFPETFALKFSPDGRLFVTADSDEVIRVYSAENDSLLAELRGHEASEGIYSLSVSADGTRLVSTSNDHTARIWELPSGKTLGSVHLLFANGPAFISPDGKTLAVFDFESEALQTGAGCSLELYAVEQLSNPIRKESLKGGFAGADFSADSRELRIFTRTEVITLDVRTGEPKVRFPLAIEQLRCFGSDPEFTRIALGTLDGLSGVWDLQSGEKVMGSFRDSRTLSDIALSMGGEELIALTEEWAALVWDVRSTSSWQENELHAPYANRQPGALLERFSGDKRHFLTTLSDHSSVLLNITTLQSDKIARPGYATGRCALNKDGSRSAIWLRPESGSGQHLALLTIRTNSVAREYLLPQSGPIERIMFTHDGRRLMTYCLGDLSCRIWNADNGELERELPFPKDYSPGTPFPDAQTWLYPSEQGFQLYNALSGKTIRLPLESGELTSMCFNDDSSKFATILRSGRAQVWQTDTGYADTEPMLSARNRTWIAFSPDQEKLLTAGQDSQIDLWRTQGSPAADSLKLGNSAIEAATWSADGRFVVARNNEGMVRLWEAENALPITPLYQFHDAVHIVNVTPERRLFIALGASAVKTKDLRPCPLSPEVLRDYANLISGRRINSSGVMMTFPASELAALSSSLVQRAPELFSKQ